MARAAAWQLEKEEAEANKVCQVMVAANIPSNAADLCPQMCISYCALARLRLLRQIDEHHMLQNQLAVWYRVRWGRVKAVPRCAYLPSLRVVSVC